MTEYQVDWGERLAEARELLRVEGGPFAGHHADVLTNQDELVEWAKRCGAAAAARDGTGAFLERHAHRELDTIYMWMPEFTINEDLYLDSRGCSHQESKGGYGDPWDSVVGDDFMTLSTREVGLKGLEALIMAIQPLVPEARMAREVAVAEEVVLCVVWQAVDSALRECGDLGMRVAVSRGEEPRIAYWDFVEGEGWDSRLSA